MTYHKHGWDMFYRWCKLRKKEEYFHRFFKVTFEYGVNYRYIYTYDYYDDGNRFHVVDAIKVYKGDDWAIFSEDEFKELFKDSGENLLMKCMDKNLKDYDLYYLEEEL